MTSDRDLDARRRRRDAALRRTRAVVAAVAAGAVTLSGLLSVVAAHAFKGHARVTTAAARQPLSTDVPGPDAIPSIAGDPAPLQPPAQPPAATPPPTATEPQVSGGS